MLRLAKPRALYESGNTSEALSVTRLVADAKKGENVRTLDGDVCNLRSGNLFKIGGGARYDARERLAGSQRLKLYRLKYVTVSPSWKE
jgi:hypothetical protein